MVGSEGMQSKHDISLSGSFVALLYLATCVAMTAFVEMTGDAPQSYLWIDVIFLVVIAGFSLRGDFLSRFASELWRHPVNFCLLLFIVYMLTMSLVYPDHGIGRNYTKQVFNRLIAGIVIGWVAFGNYSVKGIAFGPKERRWGITQRQADVTSILVALAVCTAVGLWFSTKLLPNRLLLNPKYGASYQIFGDYAALTFICISLLVDRHLRRPALASPTIAAGWLAIVCVLSCAFFILNQIAGSNSGATLVVLFSLINIVIFIYQYVSRTNRSASALMVFVPVVVIIVVVFVYIMTKLPPIRIMNFNRASSVANSSDLISKITTFNSSISGRLSILADTGVDQLRYSPFWGNLGVEKLLERPGGYIHSAISIQTHLGFVGSILFLLYFGAKMASVFRRHPEPVLVAAVTTILLLALASAFFTWLPLWFAVGAIYAPNLWPERNTAAENTPDTPGLAISSGRSN